MKIIFIVLTLLANLFGAFEVTQETKFPQQTISYSSVFIDKNSTITLENIEKYDNLFSSNAKTNYGFTKSSVWTKLDIVNQTNQIKNFILKNNYAFIREIDVLILEDGLRKKIYLGSTRDQKMREILHLYPVINLKIEPFQKVEIYIKHKTIGLTNIDWHIDTIEGFIPKSNKELLFLGLICGILLALIVYNANMFFSIAEKTYLYYAIHGASTLFLQAILHGILYLLDTPLSNLLLMNLIMILPYISILAMNQFLIDFFDFKKKELFFLKLTQGLSYICTFLILANSVRFFGIAYIIPVEIQIVFLQCCYLYYGLIGIYVFYKKHIGSLYFMLGSLSYSFFMIVGLLYVSGKIQSNSILSFVTILGILFDTIFISLALAQKISILKKEKEYSEKFMVENSKLLSIKNTVSNAMHQLKTPIVHLGGVSARISMIFEKYASIIDDNDKLSSSDLEKIVSNMDETIMYFKNLYNNTDVCEEFDIAFCIDSCLDFFEEEIYINKITINKKYASNKMNSYKDALKHALIITIENAIDSLRNSSCKNPHIDIYTTEEEGFLTIVIKDNGGGIQVVPKENIFKIYYTTKSSVGSGLGLALAKMLVEVKLLGSIGVENHEDKAVFRVTIPVYREKKIF